MKLELNDHEPIFIQISKAIEDEILCDSIKEGMQVPSTTELSKFYKINPATVLKGVNILVDKEILFKKRGIGMFVSKGAKEIIKNGRKENFKEVYLKDLISEAKKLGITKEELLDMINDVKEDISVLEYICIVREKEFFLKDYKVKSIFNMHSKFYKNYDYNLQKKLSRLFEINEELSYKSLSRGQKTLLSNIIGICSNCSITIFDEPTVGLDAVNRNYFYDALIESYSENPRTIIIATHLIEEVENLLEDVVIIKDGNVKITDSLEDIRKKAYYISGNKENLNSIFELENQTPIKRFGDNYTYWYYGDLNQNIKDKMDKLNISYENISLNELFLSMNRKDVALYE